MSDNPICTNHQHECNEAIQKTAAPCDAKCSTLSTHNFSITIINEIFQKNILNETHNISTAFQTKGCSKIELKDEGVDGSKTQPAHSESSHVGYMLRLALIFPG